MFHEELAQFVFACEAVKIVHVPFDQRAYRLRYPFGGFESLQNAFGELFPDDGVGNGVAVLQHTLRFAYVVQQRGEADVAFGVLDGAKGVFEDVVIVEIGTLLHTCP